MELLIWKEERFTSLSQKIPLNRKWQFNEWRSERRNGGEERKTEKGRESRADGEVSKINPLPRGDIVS